MTEVPEMQEGVKPQNSRTPDGGKRVWSGIRRRADTGGAGGWPGDDFRRVGADTRQRRRQVVF